MFCCAIPRIDEAAPIAAVLKDGVLLCRVINVLKPDAVPPHLIHTGRMPFKCSPYLIFPRSLISYSYLSTSINFLWYMVLMVAVLDT